MLAASKVKMSVSEKEKRTGTQAKNVFVKTNDIFSPLLKTFCQFGATIYRGIRFSRANRKALFFYYTVDSR